MALMNPDEAASYPTTELSILHCKEKEMKASPATDVLCDLA